MGIETPGKKMPAVGAMKKRNKRTEIKAHEQLTTLTEHILAQMGEEGRTIRKKLQLFYQRRAGQSHSGGAPRFAEANGEGSGAATRARR
jgi:hypothetical protein